MQSQQIHYRLLGMLCCLTLLFISWQIALFSIHYHVSDLVDSFANTSISNEFFHSVILLPIFVYILIQICSYALIIAYVYFVSIAIGHYFQLRPSTTYWFGIFYLVLTLSNLLALNSYYFPFSFFTSTFFNHYFLWFSGLCWAVLTLFAYLDCFGAKNATRYDGELAKSSHILGWLFIILLIINGLCALPSIKRTVSSHFSQPNIILIGLDSLRPDFTGFYGNQAIHTPTIDQFLRDATSFADAFTPLARTFPSWVSILTAKHPKHHGARNNLANPATVNTDTLAKQLQHTGYHALYASDEKRFSNITARYGFDQLVGPSMGVNDFILGGLSDFPVANLLTKMPIAKFILPYNFANRAAAITYHPNQFLAQINDALSRRPHKPLFLAVHFCLTHWPYTWADAVGKNESMSQQYRHSVEAIDTQLKQLLDSLQQHGLLKNSIVVLLSDHGTTLGLPHDTLLDKKNYHGDVSLLKQIPVSRLSSTSPDSVDFKHDYTINTAYGQGTNVSSLKQYRTLLAFQRFGGEPFKTQKITAPVSLTDITPTLLAILKLPPLKNSDGVSLANYLHSGNLQATTPRAFFIETGDSLTEIETDHIYLEKIVSRKIGIYRVDIHTGLLTMDPTAEKSINVNKQRAIIYDDWLLAHYPASPHNKLVPINKHTSEAKITSFVIPAYYVLVNTRTGQWTIGLDTSFAKTAPVSVLNSKLHEFYGDEIY